MIRSFGALAPEYDRLRANADLELRARLTLEACVPPWSGTALDVGCGTGTLLASLRRRRPDLTLIGADLSAAMLHQAARGATGRTLLLRANARGIPLPAQVVDLACYSLSLHHLGDESLALAEAARVLRPGGWITIWTLAPSHIRGHYLNQFFPSVRDLDLARFTPAESLGSALSGLGFKSVTWREIWQGRRQTWAQLLERVERRFISTLWLLAEAEYQNGLERIRARAQAEPAAAFESQMGWVLLQARRA